MKQIMLASTLLLAALSAGAQGRVGMNSVQAGAYVRFSNVVTRAWAENVPGSEPGSVGWISVGLYWGYDPSHLDYLAGPLATMGSNVTGGMVLSSTGGGTRTITDEMNLPVTSPVYFQLRAWTGSYTTYGEAMASGDPTVNVSRNNGLLSAPIVMATPNRAAILPVTVIPWGGNGWNPLVVEIGPLVSDFGAVPEPTLIALLGVGLTGLIFARKRTVAAFAPGRS
jgi:hypothetical protein